MLTLFHVNIRVLDELGIDLSKRVVKFKQIAFDRNGYLHALDEAGEIWFWHYRSKEWVKLENPVEDMEIEEQSQ